MRSLRTTCGSSGVPGAVNPAPWCGWSVHAVSHTALVGGRGDLPIWRQWHGATTHMWHTGTKCWSQTKSGFQTQSTSMKSNLSSTNYIAERFWDSLVTTDLIHALTTGWYIPRPSLATSLTHLGGLSIQGVPRITWVLDRGMVCWYVHLSIYRAGWGLTYWNGFVCVKFSLK